MKQTLPEKIADTSRRLRVARPRSHLRLKLELQLRDLVVRQLKKELRSAA